MNRRLYRCRHDQRIAGVASGVAEYFDLDPSLVRVLWVVSVFFGGIGLLLYIAMAIIVPVEPEEGSVPAGAAGEASAPPPTGWQPAPAGHRHAARRAGNGTTFVGIVLILFGGLALVDTLLPAWADGGRFLWPAFILGIGALLVATAMRSRPTES